MQLDTKATMMFQAQKKSVFVAYLLYAFLGAVGIHLLYLKQWFRFIILALAFGLAIDALIDHQYQTALVFWIVYGLSQTFDLLFLWSSVNRTNNRIIEKLEKIS